MNIELHLLQNFAPSNLNRDDTGAPKSCEFGGYRRARISSQCLKRAAREHVEKNGLLRADELGKRSRQFKAELVRQLRAATEMEEGFAAIVAEVALRSLKVKLKADLTEYLLFLGSAEIKQMVEVCQAHRPVLEEYAQLAGEQSAKKKSKKKAEMLEGEEADASDEVKMPKDLQKDFNAVQNAIRHALDLKSAADVAMFGRMLARLPEKNVDAACQVAHAVSTNAVNEVEFDYFTAVDDLRKQDEPGAGQIGTMEFNSACYYRYANINIEQLMKNLANEELARRATAAFLQAFVEAVPPGKANSTAPQSPPSLVLAIVREQGWWSLANAFAMPIRPTSRDDASLVENSIGKLDRQFAKMNAMYGDFAGLRKIAVCTEHDDQLDTLKEYDTKSVRRLIDETVTAAFDGNKGESDAPDGKAARGAEGAEQV
jgi:CRISPR system Cascade subunit CasC